MGIKKMLNKRKEEKQRRMLKQKPDKELVKRAETVAEEHPETAKTLLENVGDTELKLDTLSQVQEHLDPKHVAEVVSTIPPEEGTNILEDEGLTQALKETAKGAELLKEVISQADDVKPVVDNIDLYTPRELGKLLPDFETEEERIEASSKKIAQIFLDLNGANMLYTDIERGLESDSSIIEVAEKAVKEIRKVDTKHKYDGAPINELRARLFSLTKLNEKRQESVEEQKKEQVEEWFQKGEIGPGNMGTIILTGFPFEEDRFDMLKKYRGTTVKKEIKKKGITFQEDVELLSKEEKMKIISSLSVEYKDQIIFEILERQEEKRKEEENLTVNKRKQTNQER